jgi:hypothetical protein
MTKNEDILQYRSNPLNGYDRDDRRAALNTIEEQQGGHPPQQELREGMVEVGIPLADPHAPLEHMESKLPEGSRPRTATRRPSESERLELARALEQQVQKLIEAALEEFPSGVVHATPIYEAY